MTIEPELDAADAILGKAAQPDDTRLTQPAQLVAGMAGGAVASHYGAKYAGKLVEKPARRAGRRLGAYIRHASMQAGKIGEVGHEVRIAAHMGRAAANHQARLIGRLGYLGTKANAIGLGAAAAGAAGDYAGDFAARKLMGVKGKPDEYRHQSMLGVAGGAAGGIIGERLVNGARKLRGTAGWKKALLRYGAGVVGGAAGEFTGNVQDAKYNVTQGIGEATALGDRRFARYAKNPNLGKADTAPSYSVSNDKYSDSQMGYATPYQRSWLPYNGDYKPQRLAVAGGGTGQTGNTTPTGNASGFQDWRSAQKAKEFWGPVTGSLGSYSSDLVQGMFNNPGGSGGSGGSGGTMQQAEQINGLAKRMLSDAEHQQRVDAAHAPRQKRSDEGKYAGIRQSAWGQGDGKPGRTLPGGPSTRGTASIYSQYRAHKVREFQDVTPETTRGGFKRHSFAPQKPSGMSDDQYHAMAVKAGALLGADRQATIDKASQRGVDVKGRTLVPEGTNKKDLHAAVQHGQMLAMHDVGLGHYQFGMDDDMKQRMTPLKPLILFARRRSWNALNSNFKGQWKQFKDEHGVPFADNRKDQDGNVRRRFYPNMELVKALPKGSLVSTGVRAVGAVAGAGATVARKFGLKGGAYKSRFNAIRDGQKAAHEERAMSAASRAAFRAPRWNRSPGAHGIAWQRTYDRKMKTSKVGDGVRVAHAAVAATSPGQRLDAAVLGTAGGAYGAYRHYRKPDEQEAPTS